ncbi:MAG: dihydropteroate synthase-like protein [Desulfurococcaceae archaeon]
MRDHQCTGEVSTRVVLVTGKIACSYLENIADEARSKLKIDTAVLCLPIPVAAMITAEYLARELPRYRDVVCGADLVVVPGFASGDMRLVKQVIGVEVVKGPRYAHDLIHVLKLVTEGFKLSPLVPADEVLAEYLRDREYKVLSQSRSKASANKVFEIGGLPVSSEYPLLIAEVYTDGTSVNVENLIYSDIIVVGAPYGAPHERVKELVENIRRATGKPVGIDSPELNLVLELAESVELVNGVPVDMVDRLVNYADTIGDKPIVITSPQQSAEERVSVLLEAHDKLRRAGFKRIVLDPVLSPPLIGLSESLKAYIELKRRARSVPLLMGVGNVTELADADSVGLNALLAFIGVELGVELFLTTEASVKTRGCIRELRRALDMAVVARELKRPPKDLSLNLLYLKSKKRTTLKLPTAQEVVEAREKHKVVPDPRGYFKIHVDHDSDSIVLQHYRYDSKEPTIEIRGKDPYCILRVLIERNLASRLDHYFYIGYELAKAEIALKIGKEYMQDENLF